MPKPKKRESQMVAFKNQRTEPQRRIEGDSLDYLNRNQIENGYLFLGQLGIDILHVGDKPAVYNGAPQVFMVKDGKVSTLEENGIEIGSGTFWEVVNMGQVFAFPAGETDPVQIQLDCRGSSSMFVSVSEPLDLKEGFPVDKPKEPDKPQEPRWYHRWFKFGNNRVICDRYDQYVKDYTEWKKTSDAQEAKAKSIAQTIKNTYGDQRALLSMRPELNKAEEAKRDFAETKSLMEAKRKQPGMDADINQTETCVKNVLSFYQPKPELHDKWLKRDPNNPEDKHSGNIYTKEQFDKLTTIKLTDDLKVGGQRVSEREFGMLAMFASREQDIGLKIQNVKADPKPVINALVTEKFTEDEAKNLVTISSSELTTRSLMAKVPRGDTGNYIEPGIQPARERALEALQEYRDGNNTKLVGILVQMVGETGRTALSNALFSENMLAQNKMAAELLDMVHRDPKLEAAVRQEYERYENAFEKNHPQYVKHLSFDEQVRVIRSVQKIDKIQQDSVKAQKKLLDARIEGEGNELSAEEKRKCARDILKYNLFKHQYGSYHDSIFHAKKRNNETKYFKDLNEFTTGLLKYEGVGMGMSNKGGSSAPASPYAIAQTGLANRCFPKSEFLNMLENPQAMTEIDKAVDDLILREGLDKATTRELCDKLVMENDFPGKKVEQMLNDAEKNPEKQKESQLEKNEILKNGPGEGLNLG